MTLPSLAFTRGTALRDAVLGGADRLIAAMGCKVAWLTLLSLLAGTPAQQPSDAARAAVRQLVASDGYAHLREVMLQDVTLLASRETGEGADAADRLLAALVELSAGARLPGNGAEPERQRLPWQYSHEIRLDLVRALANRPAGHEVTQLLVWLWRHCDDGEVRAIAAGALDQLQTLEIDRLFLAMVTDGCAVPSACLLALDRIERRHLSVDPDALLRLCAHFHAGVRGQARALAGKLGLHPNDYDPARSLGPDLEQLLVFVGGLVAEPVPVDAAWGSLHFPATCFIRPTAALDLDGWLLQRGAGDQPWRFMTSFGEVRTLALNRMFVFDPRDAAITFTPSSLRDFAQHLMAEREHYEQTNDFGTKFRIAWDQGLLRDHSPLPEHWCGSASEWSVAAWLFVRGDRTNAGRLLLPPLQGVQDLRDYLRPLLERAAGQLGPAMLIAFADDRDYGRAMALARKLVAPEFASVIDQELAFEVLEQLPRRQDDFRTLQMPTPAQWRQQQQVLSRAQQIDYLVARLRLLHCGDMIDNLQVSYTLAQYGEPVARHESQPTSGDDRVNPFLELLRMDLAACDLPALLPALESRDFILGYCCRTEAPRWLQGPHRVAAVAACICNQIVQQTLIDPSHLPCEDAAARQGLRHALLDHAEHHGVERCTERLAVRMRGSEDWEDVRAAFWNLYGFDPVRAVAGVREVGRHAPEHMPQIVRLMVLLDRAEFLGEARDWLHADVADVRFFAAVLLLRHRQEAATALAVVRERLAQHGGEQLVEATVEALLACGLPEGRALLLDLLAGRYGYTPTTALVQRLVRAGQVEAFTALGSAIHGKSGLPGRPADERSRWLLTQLGAWWPDVDVSILEDENHPAEPVAAVLGRRLAEDWQRILSGEPPTMRSEELSLPWDGLRSFARGWIWNPR